jgi:hypothetical protein
MPCSRSVASAVRKRSRIFRCCEVGHDGLKTQLGMLRETGSEGCERSRVIPLNALTRHAGVDLQMQREWRFAGVRDNFGQPRELLHRAEHRRQSVTNDLFCFALEKAGEYQRAVVLQLWLQDARLIEARDSEPVAPIGSEYVECLCSAVTVGVGFDDRDNIRIDTRSLLTQNGIVAEQCATRNLCPCGPGGRGSSG